MAYNNSCTRSILDLPVDLQIDVLLRVSPNVLLPLKCVCKLWFTLIKDPIFAGKYSNQKRQYPILCSSTGSSFLMIDINEPQKNRARVVRPLRLPDNGRGSEATNVVNGLACIYQIDWQQHKEPIYLFNLTTHETIPLLCPPPPQPCSGEIMFSRRQCHFGYDPGTKQYKLLHLWFYDYTSKKIRRDNILRKRKEGCEVFSLGTDDQGWRRIELSGNLICDRDWNILEKSFCYDGIIYWILSHRRFGIPGKVITQFHVAQEKFDYIEFPQGQDPSKAKLALIRGQISLVSLSKQYAYPSRTGTATLNFSVKQIIGRNNNGEPLWQSKVSNNWTIPVYPTYWPDPNELYRSSDGTAYFKVTCSDFGLVSLVQQAFERPDVVIVDCYNLASGKQFNIKVNHANDNFSDGSSKFCSSRVVENIIPLKYVVSSSSAD